VAVAVAVALALAWQPARCSLSTGVCVRCSQARTRTRLLRSATRGWPPSVHGWIWR
jgi:hypothetical protein